MLPSESRKKISKNKDKDKDGEATDSNQSKSPPRSPTTKSKKHFGMEEKPRSQTVGNPKQKKRSSANLSSPFNSSDSSDYQRSKSSDDTPVPSSPPSPRKQRSLFDFRKAEKEETDKRMLYKNKTSLAIQSSPKLSGGSGHSRANTDDNTVNLLHFIWNLH